MGFPEFVVVIASIMALNPLAMDMMLPALPNIASAFDITIANERHEADECTMRDHPHANAANETGIEKASDCDADGDGCERQRKVMPEASTLAMQYSAMPSIRTGRRPKRSESGPMMNWPTPKPIRNVDRTACGFWWWKRAGCSSRLRGQLPCYRTGGVAHYKTLPCRPVEPATR